MEEEEVSQLSEKEIEKLRELLHVLEVDQEITRRRLMYLGWIKAGATWIVGVVAAVYLFRDGITAIIEFIKAGLRIGGNG